MKLIKNFIFNISFYSGTTIFAFFSIILLLFPRKYILYSLKLWSNYLSILLFIIFRINYRIEGQFPKSQVIYAIQHQSVWETIILADQLPGIQAIIMKKELINIPIIGWLFRHSGAVPLDRGKKIQSMRSLLKESEKAINRGDNLIIYPQGTRIKPGEKGKFLPGVYAIYNHLNLPVVPVALNSGKFWFDKEINGPGCINVLILKTINPGLSRVEFMEKLENSIENASKRLL